MRLQFSTRCCPSHTSKSIVSCGSGAPATCLRGPADTFCATDVDACAAAESGAGVVNWSGFARASIGVAPALRFVEPPGALGGRQDITALSCPDGPRAWVRRRVDSLRYLRAQFPAPVWP